MVNELEFESEYDGEKDDETIEYDENDCDCDDIEGVMGKVSLLSYIIGIIALGILYITYTLQNQTADDPAKMVDIAYKLAIGLAALGFLTALYFVVSFPDALDDDTDFYDDMDEDATFFGSESESEKGEEFEVSWRPGLAWFVMLIGVTSAGVFAIMTLKEMVEGSST